LGAVAGIALLVKVCLRWRARRQRRIEHTDVEHEGFHVLEQASSSIEPLTDSDESDGGGGGSGKSALSSPSSSPASVAGNQRQLLSSPPGSPPLGPASLQEIARVNAGGDMVFDKQHQKLRLLNQNQGNSEEVSDDDANEARRAEILKLTMRVKPNDNDDQAHPAGQACQPDYSHAQSVSPPGSPPTGSASPPDGSSLLRANDPLSFFPRARSASEVSTNSEDGNSGAAFVSVRSKTSYKAMGADDEGHDGEDDELQPPPASATGQGQARSSGKHS